MTYPPAWRPAVLAFGALGGCAAIEVAIEIIFGDHSAISFSVVSLS